MSGKSSWHTPLQGNRQPSNEHNKQIINIAFNKSFINDLQHRQNIQNSLLNI